MFIFRLYFLVIVGVMGSVVVFVNFLGLELKKCLYVLFIVVLFVGVLMVNVGIFVKFLYVGKLVWCGLEVVFLVD